MSQCITPGSYELVPLFQIRMAGVPFDILSGLVTPASARIAREIAARKVALDTAASAALEALRKEGSEVNRRHRERLRRAIGMRLSIEQSTSEWPSAVERYSAERAALEGHCALFEHVLKQELDAAAVVLHEGVRRYLPSYAVFGSAAIDALQEDRMNDQRWDRQRDRHLLLYLQRLATKNETFSCFGPSGWGRVEMEEVLPGVSFRTGGPLRRHTYLERWVACSVVAAMNRDPEVRAEVPPRIHPNGRIDGKEFHRLDSGVRWVLPHEDLELIRKCDGRVPAHCLAQNDRIAALVDTGALVWELECPAFVVDRVSELHRVVRDWREGPARGRWEPMLRSLAAMPDAFARDPTASGRRAIMEEARKALEAAGAAIAQAPGRMLYRATNPIGEECVLESEFRLSRESSDQLAQSAAPWFDLWRDAFAFVAHRANEKLRALHAAVGRGSAVVPLPALVAAAEAAGLSLKGNGLPAVAHVAFRELKTAFRLAMVGRPTAREWELSREDCAFVRRRFEFAHFDGFTYPSADLQLAAASVEDVAAGRHRWVVAELHLAATVLQHGIYWACPDRAEFDSWVRLLANGPMCDWGFMGADLATHTMIHYESLAHLWHSFGPYSDQRRGATARPADAEVHVAEDGDVRIRIHGRDCGSFARSWVLPLGFHPFVLTLPSHTPRLTVGDVIVQREAWTLGRVEFPNAPYRCHSPMLAVDVDRLRASRTIPRFVYVRPSDAAISRLGAGGRDKDVKPVFLDLESYPFLEILGRWIGKYGEVEIVEMVPGPEELLWHESDGHRTFELRTLLAPRGARPSREVL